MFAVTARPVTFNLQPHYPLMTILLILVVLAAVYWVLTHQPLVKAKIALLKQQAQQLDEKIVQEAHLAVAQVEMFKAQTRAHNAVAANNEHILREAQGNKPPSAPGADTELAPPAVLVKAGEPGNPFPKVEEGK